MASLTKHPKSQYWSACFRLPNGKPTTRSTKLTDRKLAQEMANKWEAASKGDLSAIQAQKVISDIYRHATGQELSQFTIRSYLEKWVTGKKPELSQNSAEKYAATITEFIQFLGDRASLDLLRITVDDLRGFRADCAARSSAKTANNKLTIISQAFRTAWMDGVIPDNIAGRIKRLNLRGQQQKRDPFTTEQIGAIFKQAAGEWKGIVLFAYYTGQRLGDIVTLKWDDFDGIHDSSTAVLKLVSKKQDRVTRIPLSAPLFAWLGKVKAVRTPKYPIFHDANESFKKNNNKTAALSKQFRAILVQLGYVEKRERKMFEKGRHAARKLDPLSFHSFRHSLTSHLHEIGAEAGVVQDIVGHDSESVNQQYTHISDATKKRYIDMLPVVEC